MTDETFNEIYLRKYPKKFHGNDGRIKLYKMLTLCITYKIPDVAKVNGISVSTLYDWLKELYGSEYQEFLNRERIDLFPKIDPRMEKRAMTSESFSRLLQRKLINFKNDCPHTTRICKCSLCNKILASDKTDNYEHAKHITFSL